MDYPLGRKIGNSLEILEAVDILRGDDKDDALTVSLALIANLVSLSKNIPIEDTERLGMASCLLGAGRMKKTDVPDLSAGYVLHVNQGEKVSRGDVIATMYSSDETLFDAAEKEMRGALHFTESKGEADAAKAALIYKVIR